MLIRRLLLPAAVAALAAGAIAQPASAQLRHARFLVTFDGTVHTTWDLPRHQSAQDCYRTTLFDAGGEETWHVASTGTNKVLAVSNGVATQFQFGSWTPNAGTGQVALKAKGQVTRSRHENINYVAGTCGITQNPGGWDDPKPPTDCGTRLVNYAIQLSPEGAAGTRITPDVLLGENGIREKLGYTNCGLITPSNVVAGSWPAATGRIMAGTTPVRSLFGHQRTFVAKGHEQWDGRQPVQTVSETATTTIDWTLKFTRVR